MALSAAVELSAARLQHPALWEVRVRLHNGGGEPVRFSTATMRAPAVQGAWSGTIESPWVEFDAR